MNIPRKMSKLEVISKALWVTALLHVHLEHIETPVWIPDTVPPPYIQGHVAVLCQALKSL